LAEVAVGDQERLARFVFTERYVPKSGDGVKAEALLPFKHIELSVTRHRDLTNSEIWQLGSDVAGIRSSKEGRSIPLIGRADFHAEVARQQKLDVIPDEPPRNHANVVNWPPEKSAQMNLAQEIAARSDFVRYHQETT
jgi:hypothetical protein